uniref:Sodium-and chloride-dependent glycine transporter 2 n=1 Tax=Angiostrongylus cantonensis TaxID=6313 RepID=A0A158PAR3_ANGCA
LATLDLAVGLGNTWRFSALAYENGGSAFLFPYIILVTLFGLPTLFLEMAIGRYTSTGPSMVFKHYMPALQGICRRSMFQTIYCLRKNFSFLYRGFNLKFINIFQFTATAPYIITVILFFRAVTLEGSSNGLYYYWGKPDFSKLLNHQTWSAALIQICFSLNVGYGGVLMLASYNKKDSNCFKDAWIVVIGDFLVNVFGGATVFATLGYLSHQLKKPIEEVVSSGHSLAFVAYPEAISTVPYPSVWSVCFFLMLFLLGISSQVGRCMYENSSRIIFRIFMYTVGSFKSIPTRNAFPHDRHSTKNYTIILTVTTPFSPICSFLLHSINKKIYVEDDKKRIFTPNKHSSGHEFRICSDAVQ